MENLLLKRIQDGGREYLVLATSLSTITIPIERAGDLADAIRDFAPARPTSGTTR